MSESQNIEWKGRWRDEYLRWICGFANAEGGVLVIGRDDDGAVVGLSGIRKLLEDIPNKVRDVLGIVVDVNLRVEAGKEYLEIVVEPQAHPVSYKGEYHYRSGSTRQELKGAALSRFLLRKQGLHWDGVPVPHARLEELSEAAVDRFREEARRSGRLDAALLAESTPVLVDRLHLRERTHLKRAALLLFHSDPEVFFTGAYVKIRLLPRQRRSALSRRDSRRPVHAGRPDDRSAVDQVPAGGNPVRGHSTGRVVPRPEKRAPGGGAQRRGPQGLRVRDDDPDQRLRRQAHDLEPGPASAGLEGRRPAGEARVEAVQPRRGACVLPRGPGRGMGTRYRPHAGRLPAGRRARTRAAFQARGLVGGLPFSGGLSGSDRSAEKRRRTDGFGQADGEAGRENGRACSAGRATGCGQGAKHYPRNRRYYPRNQDHYPRIRPGTTRRYPGANSGICSGPSPRSAGA